MAFGFKKFIKFSFICVLLITRFFNISEAEPEPDGVAQELAAQELALEAPKTGMLHN